MSKGTKVDCVVISRDRADGRDGELAALKTQAIYTHHQKTIICDAELKGQKISEAHVHNHVKLGVFSKGAVL